MPNELTPQTSAWPYWTLLFCGHFGRATAASRRLNRATIGSLVLWLIVAEPLRGLGLVLAARRYQ